MATPRVRRNAPVASLVAVELGQDRAAPALVVDVAEQVQALDHAAELAQGARERRGAVPDLEHADGGVGMDVPELERAGEPHHGVVPERAQVAKTAAAVRAGEA